MDIVFLAGFACFGRGLRQLAPEKTWPEFLLRTIMIGRVGFLAVQFLPVLLVPGLPVPAKPDPVIGQNHVRIGPISIHVTGFAQNLAAAMGCMRVRLTLLKRRLHSAAANAGIGVFEWHSNADQISFIDH